MQRRNIRQRRREYGSSYKGQGDQAVLGGSRSYFNIGDANINEEKKGMREYQGTNTKRISAWGKE